MADAPSAAAAALAAANAATVASALQTDLLALSTEARRKFPEIKEACERAILLLRKIEAASASEPAMVAAIAKQDDVLHPFMLGCDAKNTKIVMMSLESIRRLLMHRAVPTTSMRSVSSALASHVEDNDENLQLKVLQTVLALLMSGVLHHGQMTETLDVCFRLQSSRFATVHSTAEASLRQTILQMFERAQTERKAALDSGSFDDAVLSAGSVPPESLPNSRDAFIFFQDVCLLANGDNAKFLRVATLPQVFALDLIETAITNHSVLFREAPAFATLIRERVCALVIKAMSSKLTFGIATRVLRIVTTLIRLYGDMLVTECEIFITMLLKTVDLDANPLWLNTLTLEVLRTFCTEATLLAFFFKSFDQHSSSTKVFHDIVQTLSSFVQSYMTSDEGIVAHPKIFHPKYLPSVSDSEPVNIAMSYGVSTCYGGILALLNSFETLCADMPAVCAKMMQTCWVALLGCVSFVMQKSNVEDLLQGALLGYQSAVFVCGTLSLNTPRDAFISSICRFALPTGTSDSSQQLSAGIETRLTPKNMLAMKALLNIAHGLGSILTSAWHIVLEAFEQLDQIIATVATRERNMNASATLVELNILAVALNKLFESSASLDHDSFGHLIVALTQVSRTALGSSRSEFADAATRSVKTYMFGSNKLLKTCLVNLARVPAYWAIVAHHFLWVTSHRSADIRRTAISYVTKLIEALVHEHGEADHAPRPSTAPAFVAAERLLQAERNSGSLDIAVADAALHAAAAASADSLSSGSPEQASGPTALDAPEESVEPRPDDVPSLERALVHTLFEMCRNTPYADTKCHVLTAVFHVLQSVGQSIHHSWHLVFKLLRQAATSEDDAIISAAFQSVQFICDDLLSALPADCVELAIRTVGRFCTQRFQVNISLSAVNQLWHLADFLRKRKAAVLEAIARRRKHHQTTSPATAPVVVESVETAYGGLWLHLYRHMETLGSDPRPEVRNCALRTLFSTLSAHGGQLDRTAWHSLVWRIVFPVLDAARTGSSQQDEARGADFVRDEREAALSDMYRTRHVIDRQWDESRQLAMQGAHRLFKAFLDHVVRLDDFAAAWQRLLRATVDIVAAGGRDLCTKIIGSFVELLLAVLRRPDVDVSFWQDALTALEDIVKQQPIETAEYTFIAITDALPSLFQFGQAPATAAPAESDAASHHSSSSHTLAAASAAAAPADSAGTDSGPPPDPVSSDAPLAPSTPTAALAVDFQWLRARVTDADRLRLLNLCDRMSLRRAIKFSLSTDPNTVQRATLKFYGALADLSDTVALALFDNLCRICYLDAERPTLSADVTDDVQYSYVTVAFVKRVLEVMALVFESSAVAVRVAVLAKLLRAIEHLLGIPNKNALLWTACVRVFGQLIRSGVAQVDAACVDQPLKRDELWNALLAVLRLQFAFNRLPSPPNDVEALAVAVVDMLANELLPASRHAPLAVIEGFVALLHQGSLRDHSSAGDPYEMFADGCLGALFVCCTYDTRIGESAAPLLAERCSATLQAFVRDDHLSGDLPLPRVRVVEVEVVLQNLRRFESAPRLFPNRFESKHGLILHLYQPLVACIGSSLASVRRLVQALLQLAGEAMGLAAPADDAAAAAAAGTAGAAP